MTPPTDYELAGTIREEPLDARIAYYAHLIERASETHGWNPAKKVCRCGWTARGDSDSAK